MIFLECNTDEFLVKSLGFTRKQISHERCKGEVIKKVGKFLPAIGIIDEDPQSIQPRDMKKYKISQTLTNIKLYIAKNDKQKKIIQISPRLEEWILNRAKSNNINPKDFNLPDNPKRIHNISHLERHKGFREFLEKLIDVDSEINNLKMWIKDSLG